MNIWIYLGIIVVSEMVLAFLFSAISQIFYKKQGLDFKSILKGTVERVFLLVALVNDYPHALTFFSALKLATRLKHKDSSTDLENKFNDFYLMGNLLSVMVAIGYVYLYHKLS